MSLNSDIEDKKALIEDRLYKREQERITNLKNKKLEKLENLLIEETLETFKPKFQHLKTEIEDEIISLDNLTKDEKPAKIEELLNKCLLLQKMLSEANKFLTTFHLEKFQDDITNLRNTINSKYLVEQKQKKFNFKQIKKKTVKEEESNPAETNRSSTISKILSKFDSDKSFIISNLEDATEMHTKGIDSMEVVISNLNNCTIYLQGNPSTVHFNELLNSKIFIGPVSGSVFVNGASGSCLHLACHQLRIHNTVKTDFHIHVSTKAIIEDTKEVRFGPYDWKYDQLESDFERSALNRNVNNWNKVDDFNWLVANVQSPNWSVI